MNKRTSYLLKNIGVLTIGNFASKILSFLFVPLYTSILSTADYGIYDLIGSTVSLVYPLLTANIVDAVMRFCMDRTYDKKEIVSVGFRFIFIGLYIAGIALIVLSYFRLIPVIQGLEWLVFAYYVFTVLDQFFIQLAKGLERVKDIAISGVLGTITVITSNIVFLVVLKCGLVGFFLSNILAVAIPAIYLATRPQVRVFLKYHKPNKQIQREMLAYCVPLIPTALGWWINSTLDRFVVAYLCGVAANGLLSIAYKIPSIISILQRIFTQAWQISAIKEYGEHDTAQFYGDTFNVINTLMCAACAWLILLSKPLAHMLYANDFYHAWQYVPFLLISSVLNTASGFLGPILSAKKDSRTMAVSAIYGSIANIVLNILLVYAIGVQGATIATAISSWIIYVVRKRAVGRDIRISGYRNLLLTWGLLYVQACVEIYTPFWYFEAILMVLMLLINRKNIHLLMRMLS